MGLIRLMMLLLLLVIQQAAAQDILTIDEAIELALKNNIQLQKQNSEIQKAETALDESGRLPNPSFTYSREDLSAGFLHYKEWTALGSIPLNFLWERWSSIEAKNKALNAQNFLMDYIKLNITAETKEKYISLFVTADLVQKIKAAHFRLNELSKAAHHKFNEGDISEYDLQRILLETEKLKMTVNQIELRRIKTENELKLLTGISLTENIVTEETLLMPDDNFVKDVLILSALKNRNDLKAVRMQRDAGEELLTNNRVKALPEINLAAGYKNQTDKLKGTVLQLEFEIPLFKRNQSEIENAKIEINLLEKEVLFFQENIKSEVSEAFTNFSVNKNLFESANTIKLDNIFNTAAYSYEQGEILLVEFIDGINAFIDASVSKAELTIDLQNSLIRLEKAVGLSLSKIENNKGR